MSKSIIIIGGGFSGLLIAYRLKTAGHRVTVIEARERLGGRIFTKLSHDTPVEMGATWLGNQHTNLLALLAELQLPIYEQYMTGTAFFQPFSLAPVHEVQIPNDAPSFRIKGGTTSIITLLTGQLTERGIMLGTPVKEIIATKDTISVVTATGTFTADIVISTLPPALLANTIQCTPQLPSDFLTIAKHTHTWMQDSVKVAFTYATPFWKHRNLSGTIFSNVGPVTEFYDHSNADNTRFALCGFISGNLNQLPPEERKKTIVQQLVHIFGSEAAGFTSYEETLWTNEPFTKAAAQNEVNVLPHQHNGHPIFSQPFLLNRLFLAGTETASVYPGYMEGAVVAANRVVGQVMGITE